MLEALVLMLLAALASKRGAPGRPTKKPNGIPYTKQPPLPVTYVPPTVITPDEPPKVTPVKPGKTVPEKVPRTYVPPGGWVPYTSGWSVARANELLRSRGVMPGQSRIETEPGTGYKVKFRGETGAEHGDRRIVRAVTAWRKT